MQIVPSLTLALAASGCASSVQHRLDRGIPAAPEGPPSPLVFDSATELAREIRTGEVSSTAVVRAFIDRIVRVNEATNAIVWLDRDRALERAAEADRALARGEVWGPLHGVPVTLKDTFEVAGVRTTAGYPPLADHVPAADSTVAALLEAAGAILLAKTNPATLAMDMQTTNPLFGTTRNPWDPTRTTGGSSGGCVAALATGMTPLSFGSDLAGSIRLPSAFVGVYGLRPTFGVTSMHGHIPPLPGGVNGVRTMAVAGPMARSIDDLELAMRVIARPHDSDATVAPLEPLVAPPDATAALRVAYATELGGVPVSREVQAAIEAFAERLRASGATVERAEPSGLPYDEVWETWGALVGMQGGYDRSNSARWLGNLFVGGRVRAVPTLRRILEPISVERYMRMLGRQEVYINQLERFLRDYDAWIVPTASTVAFPHMAPTDTFGDFNVYDTPLVVDGRRVHYYVATQAYTTPFSVTSSPVVSMPIARSASGLPIGVQVVGRRFEDFRLLHVARLLSAAGWFELPSVEPTL